MSADTVPEPEVPEVPEPEPEPEVPEPGAEAEVPAPDPEPETEPPPVRSGFVAAMDELHLQVEVMAVRVGEALDRMGEVLATGNPVLAEMAVAADDDVDAMHVSITERVYDLLGLQAPVASDLRFLVSVLRMVEEIERIGDLSLRVVKLHPDHALLSAHPDITAVLWEMAETAESVYRLAVDAWSTGDAGRAGEVAERAVRIDEQYAVLSQRIMALSGPDAARVAVAAVLAGRALERIADHAVIVGDRVRYLLTGDPAHLAAEVR